ncbi:hypothetical protein ACFSCX_21350 [Bacillus salitolerans]|uniref:Uncharacterized protein n=1 Tax=Bacillus salitolerans TaxID=1437434 RepID=A0ABW4LW59_9BACI
MEHEVSKKNVKKKPVKAFQDISDEVNSEMNFKNMQPTPEPSDFEEIEY